MNVDVIVIGAGINGAGIARRAALEGMSVLVLEQHDLASGTTAASTRLIHGGLRYLEHGEIGLVRESLREREALLEIAPHLVEPLRLYLPIYDGAKRPRWQIRIGMALYDLLSRGKSLPGHSMLSRTQMRDRLPGLAADGLVGGACYFDAQAAFPERLVVENLLDAAAHGATVMTHTAATRIVVDGGEARRVDWRRADGTTGRAAARCIVNAAGPWLDRVVARIDGAPRPDTALVDGTKGSHVVVAPFPTAPGAAVYAEAARDGRPFFVVPWNGLYLIGTTDVRYSGDPGDAAIDDIELEYLAAETQQLFPAAGDIASRVLYTQAGVRALPFSPGAAPGAITRRHAVRRHPGARNLFSVVGGKLTTYRSLAHDVLRSLRRDGLAPAEAAPGGGRGDRAPLPGALDRRERDALGAELARAFGEQRAERLLGTYGRLAASLLEAARERPELGMPTAPSAELLRAELVRGLDTEWALSLIDLLHRRTMLGLNADFGLSEAHAAAAALKELGIWDAERAADELDSYRRHAAAHRASVGKPETPRRATAD